MLACAVCGFGRCPVRYLSWTFYMGFDMDILRFAGEFERFFGGRGVKRVLLNGDMFGSTSVHAVVEFYSEREANECPVGEFLDVMNVRKLVVVSFSTCGAAVQEQDDRVREARRLGLLAVNRSIGSMV